MHCTLDIPDYINEFALGKGTEYWFEETLVSESA
jgi:hypothetical protein